MTASAPSPCDEGVVLAAPDQGGCTRRRRRGVLAATALGSSLAFLDGSMVGVALPSIQQAFEIGVAELQWVLNAYILLLGALMLAGGAAGDRLGRRRVFVTGLGIFAAASLAAGAAPGVLGLQIARAVQGVGGALLVPNSLAILSASFPKAERGRAIGSWAAASAVTGALGPALGGFLVDQSSWRLVFFVTPPLALVALYFTLRFVDATPGMKASTEAREESPNGEAIPAVSGPRQPLDVAGAITITAAFALSAYGLIQATPWGVTHPRVLAALAGAGVLTLFFFVVEARAENPLVPLDLFRSASFRGTNLLTLFLYFGLGGTFFFLPFLLIQVQGFSATATGAAFLPFTVLVGGLSRWSGGLFDRYGARLPLIVGPLVAGLGFALLAVPAVGSGYWRGYFPALLILGLGMAVSVAPLTTAVMAAVPEERAGTASGVNNATSRLANMLAIALLGALAAGWFQGLLAERLINTSLSPAQRQELVAESSRLAGLKEQAAEITSAAQSSPPGASTPANAIDEAFLATFRRLMAVAAGCAALASLTAALGIRDRELKAGAAE